MATKDNNYVVSNIVYFLIFVVDVLLMYGGNGLKICECAV